MSLIKSNRTTAGAAAIGARAKDAAAQAVPMGKRAGETAVQGAVGAKDWAAPRVQDAKELVQDAKELVQDAKEWAAPRVQEAVRGAREWAAPRLEGAADAVTTSVAPKVSSALRSTADQVRPAPAKTGVRRLLDWRWLLGLGAVVAAAGATVAVTMRRRYASATADAKDATEPDDAEQAGDPAAEASSANGRVTTPGS